ncbi:SCO family protein [Lichenicola sp.]|uniref:SCO family protein n=1 Tax=Lichenicola sp. TaxID=2804529 RepID=UPI003B00A71C
MSSVSVGGPFTLVDDQGRTRHGDSFRGRYMLIFFGYANCTDVCPQTLTEMSEALGTVDPDARRIQPLFITIDPTHDTPQRLRAYTAAFSPTLIGLTGTPSELGAVERRFHVVVEPDASNGRDGFDHSALIYLVGPDGQFIAPFPAASGRTVLQAALRRYVPASADRRS